MRKVKIGIIETNFGNIASVVNAVSYLKYNFKVLKKPKNLESFTQLVLPGVGSFNKAAKKIEKGWLVFCNCKIYSNWQTFFRNLPWHATNV